MKIKFEKCDLLFDDESMEFFSQKGEKFFIYLQVTSEVWNPKKFSHDKVVKEKIVPLSIYKTIILCDHCLFSPDENIKIIGYCPIEFECPEDVSVFI